MLSRLLFALIPQGLEEEQSTDGRVGMLTLLKLSLQYYANTFLLPLLRADQPLIAASIPWRHPLPLKRPLRRPR